MNNSKSRKIKKEHSYYKLRGFVYRLKPTKEQVKQLEHMQWKCRKLWNIALAWQQIARKTNSKRDSKFTMYKMLTIMRENDFWRELPVDIGRRVIESLDAAYNLAYVNRKKFSLAEIMDDPDICLPKFKGKDKNIILKTTYGKVEDNFVHFPKIGMIRFRKHRPLTGEVKGVTITKDFKDRWTVVIQTEEVLPMPEHKSAKVIGIDRGVNRMAVTSEGTVYPKYEGNEKDIRRLKLLEKKASWRQLCNTTEVDGKKKVIKTKRLKKLWKQLGALRAKITRDLDLYQNCISKKIAENNKVVVLEDLKIKNMSKSAKGTMEKPGKNVKAKSGLNREILGQSWGKLETKLKYKLEERGGEIVKVDPKFTSQKCRHCGHIAKENRKGIHFKCVSCGFEGDADILAAMNIRDRFLEAG